MGSQTYSTLQMRSLWPIHYIIVEISTRAISSQPVSKGGVYFLSPYQQAWRSDFLWSVKCKQKWHTTFFPSKNLKSHHEILPSLFSLHCDIMIPQGLFVSLGPQMEGECGIFTASPQRYNCESVNQPLLCKPVMLGILLLLHNLA